MRRSTTLLLLAAWLWARGPAPAAQKDEDLARQARAVLEKCCHRCHGQDDDAEGRFGYVLDRDQLVRHKKVVPGDPARSPLLEKVKKDLMPPEDEKPRPTGSEVALLERWIKAGAPPFAGPAPGPDRVAGVPDNLRREVAELARKVADFLRDQDEKVIRIGRFCGPASPAAGAGPGIALALAEELKKLGVRVEADAAFEVSGKYFAKVTKVDGDLDRQAVFLEARIKDGKNNAVKWLGRKIFGARAIASVMALTVDDLPPDEVDQDRRVRETVAHPASFLRAGRAAAGPESPYVVEVLVQSGDRYERRPAADKDGLAYVRLEKGERYAVRLINDSPHDAAVSLSIDGLSLFAFSDFKDRYTHILVPAGKAALVTGWHRTNETSDAFTVTDYANSEAARALRDSSAVGTITAAFAVAWKEGAEPPPDENSRSADVGTGRGPPLDQKYAEEKRHFGRTRAVVSVRYAR
jgi:hypothetical protein